MAAQRAPHGAGKSTRRNPLEGYHTINFTAEAMKDLDGSAARLAGAMGLDTSHQLYRLFSSACPAIQDVIAKFVKDRQNDFDHVSLPKSLRAVHHHTLLIRSSIRADLPSPS
ncbi:HelicaseC-terminal [Penicillium lividum]|nr:HelicaseC-terminal [Penicillium lividum]